MTMSPDPGFKCSLSRKRPTYTLKSPCKPHLTFCLAVEDSAVLQSPSDNRQTFPSTSCVLLARMASWALAQMADVIRRHRRGPRIDGPMIKGTVESRGLCKHLLDAVNNFNSASHSLAYCRVCLIRAEGTGRRSMWWLSDIRRRSRELAISGPGREVNEDNRHAF